MYFRSIFVACMACASEVLIWENTLALASKSTQALYKCKFYNMWTAWSYLQLQIKFKYQIVLKVKHISWSVESNQIHFLLVLEWLNARASVLYNKSILQSHYISLWVCVCACVCVCVCVCVSTHIRKRKGGHARGRETRVSSFKAQTIFLQPYPWIHIQTDLEICKQTNYKTEKKEREFERACFTFSFSFFFQLLVLPAYKKTRKMVIQT